LTVLLLQVQALDTWGNATCPQDALPFEIRVQSEAADPDATSFAVDDRWVVECYPGGALEGLSASNCLVTHKTVTDRAW
jgi:hypothetical protein